MSSVVASAQRHYYDYYHANPFDIYADTTPGSPTTVYNYAKFNSYYDAFISNFKSLRVYGLYQ